MTGATSIEFARLFHDGVCAQGLQCHSQDDISPRITTNKADHFLFFAARASLEQLYEMGKCQRSGTRRRERGTDHAEHGVGYLLP